MSWGVRWVKSSAAPSPSRRSTGRPPPPYFLLPPVPAQRLPRPSLERYVARAALLIPGPCPHLPFTSSPRWLPTVDDAPCPSLYHLPSDNYPRPRNLRMATDLRVGGKYRIGKKIGSGSFGQSISYFSPASSGPSEGAPLLTEPSFYQPLNL